MAVYRYQRVDVFTDQPFCGNPLAVFPNAEGLDTETMQRIAGELNLSETSFVFPSSSGNAAYEVRVFTPTAELMVAGAPTLGTVFVLARESMLPDPRRVVLQEQSGPISVTLVSPMTTMQQPDPDFGAEYTDHEAAAAMLGLGRRDLLLPAPVQVVVCAKPYTLIPVKDLDALARIQFRADIWRRTIGQGSAPDIVAFTPGVRAPVNARARVFAPAVGVAEDPATGTACACIGAYLIRYGLVECGPETHLTIAQGVEMGRPSEVHVIARVDGRRVTSLRVGGQCVWTGQGELHV
jgi:trans-2,3-dihydro-3-hydroxyanthranilate isomerase